ncbi:MAG TPA: ECF-type sigma factor [Gemmatimonadota bacterium]|nr:ECF-type sigma factor [Gemmatimonadota bacterium]
MSTGTEPSQPSQVTELLQETDSGRLPPIHELVPIAYEELRDIAHWQLAREHRNITLQTTALVHEAYVRLVDDSRVTSRGRAYFFAAAARAMRQVLIDAARRRGAAKRGGGVPLMRVEWGDDRVDAYASELLDLDRALEDLGRRNPRHMQVVECRFFGGMSVEETAVALGVSERTIKADWALARAWLFQALDKAG